MNLFKTLFGFCALTLMLNSCSKELSTEEREPDKEIDAKWQFTEEANTFSGDVDTAYFLAATGQSILTLEGTRTNGSNGSLIIQIVSETITPGPYTYPVVNFVYIENGQLVYEMIPSNAGFTVNITSIDSVSVTGTFSGLVQDKDGIERAITDGSFSAPLNGGPTDIEPDPEGDYLPERQQWTYSDQPSGTPGTTLTITPAGDTVVPNLGTFRILANSRTGEHKYYRKSGTNYYELLQLSFGLPVSDPPLVELNILREDAIVGEQWESGAYQITPTSGPAVTVQLRFTLEERDFSAQINGRIYNNLIEVRTDLLVMDQNGVFQDTEDPIRTIFAKGVGIIVFEDLSDDTEWFIQSFN